MKGNTSSLPHHKPISAEHKVTHKSAQYITAKANVEELKLRRDQHINEIEEKMLKFQTKKALDGKVLRFNEYFVDGNMVRLRTSKHHRSRNIFRIKYFS